jgi:hypothetical protein
MKVDDAHDSDKTDVLLVAEHNHAILDGEKNGWIAGNGCGIDLHNRGVMTQDDGKVPEVEPHFVKSATPVVDEPIDNRAAVQLHANCIEDDASVDWKGLEGIFHNLEGVSMLKDRNVGAGLAINRCRQTSHLDSDAFPHDKRHVMDLLGWSRGHHANKIETLRMQD